MRTSGGSNGRFTLGVAALHCREHHPALYSADSIVFADVENLKVAAMALAAKDLEEASWFENGCIKRQAECAQSDRPV